MHNQHTTHLLLEHIIKILKPTMQLTGESLGLPVNSIQELTNLESTLETDSVFKIKFVSYPMNLYLFLFFF
jgi:hypothetical protein